MFRASQHAKRRVTEWFLRFVLRCFSRDGRLEDLGIQLLQPEEFFDPLIQCQRTQSGYPHGPVEPIGGVRGAEIELPIALFQSGPAREFFVDGFECDPTGHLPMMVAELASTSARQFAKSPLAMCLNLGCHETIPADNALPPRCRPFLLANRLWNAWIERLAYQDVSRQLRGRTRRSGHHRCGRWSIGRS